MTYERTRKRDGLNRRAAVASVATATFLLVIKLYAASRTGSVAMLGSLADTGLDLLASLVTLFGVRYAAMPADEDHRFGHGKAEALAALFQVSVITISAIGIGWQASRRLLDGGNVEAAEYGVGVSLVAIAATFALTAYQRRVLKQTDSLAISTDNLHYQSDLALNLAVIAVLLVEGVRGMGWIDPVSGFAIALWLLFGAWRGASRAIDQLLDREWPDEKRDAFLRVAAEHPALRGIHDLRTRTSGNKDFVQFHVWVDGRMSVRQAHDVMDEVEDKLKLAFPDVEILIHPDPEGLVDEEPMAAKDVTEDLPPMKDGQHKQNTTSGGTSAA